MRIVKKWSGCIAQFVESHRTEETKMKKKTVITTMGIVLGTTVLTLFMMGKIKEKECENEKQAEKNYALYMMMNQWVKVKQEGKQISAYFNKKGYNKIAVYGMGYAGQRLLEELKNSSEIKVMYAIDQNASSIYADVDMVTPEDTLEKVDAIVVTAITYFDEIKEKLCAKVECPIVSLEDILYEI